MEGIVFTNPLPFYVKLEGGCYIQAPDYNEKKVNNQLESIKFSYILNCLQSLDEYIRGNFKMEKFTKSLFPNQTPIQTLMYTGMHKSGEV